ncbi:hypothetical protein BVX93_01280 [bacterium B13(2017)]|nr:hypothetical protein BVX93_01280 [bacterium B13(2017)]
MKILIIDMRIKQITSKGVLFFFDNKIYIIIYPLLRVKYTSYEILCQIITNSKMANLFFETANGVYPE